MSETIFQNDAVKFQELGSCSPVVAVPLRGIPL